MQRSACALSGALVAAALLFAPGAAAQTDDPKFFEGQTITLIVGSATGGGYDNYARPVARHLGRFIPGQPSVVLRHMPGAASIVAANYLFSSASRDGLTMGAIQRQIPFEPLRGNAAARYEPLKFNWIGSVTAETSVFITSNKAPQKTADDLRKHPLIAASLGTGTDGEVETMAMKRLMGFPIKMIAGYRGTPDALLALERGEVEGIHGISWSFMKTKQANKLRDGSVRLLLQSALGRHPELKDTPLLLDMAKDADDRRVWDLILAPKVMSRPYLLPPGVPASRVATINAAFEKMLADPEYLAEMASQELEVLPTSGPEIVRLIERLYTSSPDVVEKMRQAIRPEEP